MGLVHAQLGNRDPALRQALTPHWATRSPGSVVANPINPADHAVGEAFLGDKEVATQRFAKLWSVLQAQGKTPRC